MSPFPEKAAAKTYIKLMKSHNCNIVSDSEQSDAGMEIWKEMLNNPELKDRIFVWDNKNRKMIDTIKPEEIWGHEDKFKDILIGIMV